jgi:hypothetical protein
MCRKQSLDGSGKCTIRRTDALSEVVHGVLFTTPDHRFLTKLKEKGMIAPRCK